MFYDKKIGDPENKYFQILLKNIFSFMKIKSLIWLNVNPTFFEVSWYM